MEIEQTSFSGAAGIGSRSFIYMPVWCRSVYHSGIDMYQSGIAWISQKAGGDRMNSAMIMVTLTAAIVTAVIRFSPFWLLSRKKKEVPGWVQYLGRILPPAVMSVLLVYCLRGIDFSSGSHGIPELISTLVVILLHMWKRNTLLSICAGTVFYMILIRI